jgi:hypothetical protein
VSSSRRHGRGPDPSEEPTDQVPPAPLSSLARRIELDSQTRGVAERPVLRRTSPADDLRPLPGVVLSRDAALAAVQADLLTWFDKEPFADSDPASGCLSGVTTMGALCLQAEVCDWRPLKPFGLGTATSRPASRGPPSQTKPIDRPEPCSIRPLMTASCLLIPAE